MKKMVIVGLMMVAGTVMADNLFNQLPEHSTFRAHFTAVTKTITNVAINATLSDTRNVIRIGDGQRTRPLANPVMAGPPSRREELERKPIGVGMAPVPVQANEQPKPQRTNGTPISSLKLGQ